MGGPEGWGERRKGRGRGETETGVKGERVKRG